MALADDPHVTLYRVTRAEREIESLKRDKADAKDVQALTNEVRALRRALITFLVTIAGSAVLFAFTVSQLVAHH